MKLYGIVPKHQVLNNEASAAYKEVIRQLGITYQLVPSDNHRRNIVEKAIKTWKYHFIGVLHGTAATFPMHLLCQLIPQAERKLLLLRQEYANPNISAYAYLYGPHNYSDEPFSHWEWKP